MDKITNKIEEIVDFIKKPGFIYIYVMIAVAGVASEYGEKLRTNIPKCIGMSNQESHFIATIFGNVYTRKKPYKSEKKYKTDVLYFANLLKELHNLILIERRKEEIRSNSDKPNISYLIIEKTLYGGTGVFYDQYIEAVPEKYRNHNDLVKNNYGMNIDEIILFLKSIEKNITIDSKRKDQKLHKYSEELLSLVSVDLSKMSKEEKNIMKSLTINPQSNYTPIFGEFYESERRPFMKIGDNSLLNCKGYDVFRSLYRYSDKNLGLGRVEIGASNEVLCFNYLKTFFKGWHLYHGVKIKEGKIDKGEIDVVIKKKSILILVEIKTKIMEEQTRKGDMNRLFDANVRHIKKGIDQLNKNEKLVFSSKHSTIYDGKAKKIINRKEKYEVFKLIILPDDFNILNFAYKKVSNFSNITCISIFSLEIIFKYLKSPYLVFDFLKEIQSYPDLSLIHDNNILLGAYCIGLDFRFIKHLTAPEYLSELIDNDYVSKLNDNTHCSILDGYLWINGNFLNRLNKAKKHSLKHKLVIEERKKNVISFLEFERLALKESNISLYRHRNIFLNDWT